MGYLPEKDNSITMDEALSKNVSKAPKNYCFVRYNGFKAENWLSFRNFAQPKPPLNLPPRGRLLKNGLLPL
jgi:hypothetical protein